MKMSSAVGVLLSVLVLENHALAGCKDKYKALAPAGVSAMKKSNRFAAVAATPFALSWGYAAFNGIKSITSARAHDHVSEQKYARRSVGGILGSLAYSLVALPVMNHYKDKQFSKIPASQKEPWNLAAEIEIHGGELMYDYLETQLDTPDYFKMMEHGILHRAVAELDSQEAYCSLGPNHDQVVSEGGFKLLTLRKVRELLAQVDSTNPPAVSDALVAAKKKGGSESGEILPSVIAASVR
jgi:hypothetical protein